MKKTILILIITLVASVGCTKIPASEETGIKPGEYEGQQNAEELKSENEQLKTELEQTKDQLKKLEEDFSSINNNNDLATKKLTEAESIIMMFQDNKLPKFTVEKADKNAIVSYLNEKSNFLSKSYKKIEMIPLVSIENKIIFYTAGYGDQNQVFSWDTAKTEPALIDGAVFNIKGNWKWLLQDKYLLLSSSDNTNKILDISTMKVSNVFKGMDQNMYYFNGTTNVLIKRDAANSESPFVVYDFATGSQSEILLDNKSKFNDFIIDETINKIKFTGKYEENGAVYSVEAVMNLDSIKDKYITAPSSTQPSTTSAAPAPVAAP